MYQGFPVLKDLYTAWEPFQTYALASLILGPTDKTGSPLFGTSHTALGGLSTALPFARSIKFRLQSDDDRVLDGQLLASGAAARDTASPIAHPLVLLFSCPFLSAICKYALASKRLAETLEDRA